MKSFQPNDPPTFWLKESAERGSFFLQKTSFKRFYELVLRDFMRAQTGKRFSLGVKSDSTSLHVNCRVTSEIDSNRQVN